MTREEIIERMGWQQSAENAMSDIITRIERIVRRAEAAEGDRIANEAKQIIKRAEARGAVAEREACAAWLERGVDLAGLAGAPEMQRFTGELLLGCAKAIRARGEK